MASKYVFRHQRYCLTCASWIGNRAMDHAQTMVCSPSEDEVGFCNKFRLDRKTFKINQYCFKWSPWIVDPENTPVVKSREPEKDPPIHGSQFYYVRKTSNGPLGIWQELRTLWATGVSVLKWFVGWVVLVCFLGAFGTYLEEFIRFIF